jgi:hypothetical protein
LKEKWKSCGWILFEFEGRREIFIDEGEGKNNIVVREMYITVFIDENTK